MPKYNYEFGITAQEEAEADRKIKALSVLGQKLTVKMLERLAYIVEHEPEKIEMAKPFLNL